jgi:FADH2 O2-dependent halogenase
LPALRPLAKWGTWQRSYPDIACGLKRGFTFHHHTLGVPDSPDPHRQDQLLVAASPCDAIADTHWYRADLDRLLLQEAQELGVDYVDQVVLHRFTDEQSHVKLEGQREGRDVTFRAKFVVDATGPRGFLHHALQLGERELTGCPATQALYSHFSGVSRLQQQFPTAEMPPYPIDDAAVHHVFDGGWIWVLHFNNGITSAGVAATDSVSSNLRLSEGAPAWQRLLDLLPAVRRQFVDATAVRPFTHLRRLSFRSAQVVGPRWVLLPSAAGFVDPLLSTGFPLTLLGLSRLAEAIEQDWETPRFMTRLKTYAAQTDGELLATARLTASLYANMKNFPVFVSLSLLYFAAASYSEAARRLGKSHLASSFLFYDHPVFGPECVRLFERAQQPLTKTEAAALAHDILVAIEPFNVAGLGRQERRNWYPVDTNDLLQGAGKLCATEDEIRAMLERCGLLPEP